jgi:hypothetical protein
MCRLRTFLLTGLFIGTVGIALVVLSDHHHAVCTAPFGLPITVGQPPPSRGNCSLFNSLFYLGIGLGVLETVLAFGTLAAKPRS